MRFSPDGRLLVCVAALVGMAALAVPFPALGPAFLLAVLALWLVALTDALLIFVTPLPRVQRVVPERLLVGRPATFALELESASDRTGQIALFDELPRDLRDVDPSWSSLRLAPKGSQRLEYSVRPWVRGRRVLGPVVAMVASPLGFWRRRVMAGAGESVDVHPDTSHFLRREALHPERVLASLGLKPARKRGDGMDFESLRDYVPGDDPRHIDWRATARRGRPVSRLYQHERNHTLIVALDTSRLMGSRSGEGPASGSDTRASERARGEGYGRTKLDHAIDAALALIFAALAAGDRAGLCVFDRELRVNVDPRSRRAELGLFVDALQPLQSRLVEADYRVLTREILARQNKRALVVVLTDFVESERAELLQPLSLLARRHQVLLVALRDRLFADLGGSGEGAAAGAAAREAALYRGIVLDDLLREREETLARLSRAGLHTLDLSPEQVTAGVLNRYLALRQREA